MTGQDKDPSSGLMWKCDPLMTGLASSRCFPTKSPPRPHLLHNHLPPLLRADRRRSVLLKRLPFRRFRVPEGCVLLSSRGSSQRDYESRYWNAIYFALSH